MQALTKSSCSNPGSIRSLSAKADGSSEHLVASNTPLLASVEIPKAAMSQPMRHAIFVN